jgi:predicted Na+-dependent transporter
MEALLPTLKIVFKISVFVVAIASVMGMGLGLKVRQVLEPLRNIPRVAIAIVVNFILVPLLCWLVTLVLPLSDGFRIGLFLLAAGAGSPFVPLLVKLSKGNNAWAAALMVLFTFVTVIYMPLVLPLMLPGVKVDPVGIAKSLAVVMMLPLTAGLFVHAWNERLARRLVPIFAVIGNITLVLILVLVAILGHQQLIGAVGRYGILAAAVMVLAATGLGYVLGGPGRDTRCALGFGTGSRNVSAAMVIAAENFSDKPDVVLIAVLALLATVSLQVPLAKWLGRASAVDLDKYSATTKEQSSEQQPLSAGNGLSGARPGET